MAISREVIHEIRNRVHIEDIVSQTVTLKAGGSGGRLKGLCPFHQENTPSFHVDTRKGMFYCFGCAAGGDVIRFMEMVRGIGFQEAVGELAEMSGIELRQTTPAEKRRIRQQMDILEVCKLAADKFAADLHSLSSAESARQYLKERQIRKESIDNFQIGFAVGSYDSLLNHLHTKGVSAEVAVGAGLARWRDPEAKHRGAYSLFRDRVVIPIRDTRGRVVAFGGRSLPGADSKVPKYINSPETDAYKKSKTLFALSKARPSIQRESRAIIVEGYFDVIALHQMGFRESIAACGTALTPQHLQILRPLTQKVVAVFDMDEAGIRAAEKSLPLFLEAQMEALHLDLGDSKDPDEYFLSNSADDFNLILEKAKPLFLLKMKILQKRHGASPGGQQQTVDALLPLLRKMPGIAQDSAIQLLSRRLGIRETAIQSQIGSVKQQPIHHEPIRRDVPVLTRDIIWLLIHFPTLVTPELEAIDPCLISSNQNLLFALGLLMQGHDIAAVVEQLPDQGLKRLLLEQSMRPSLYSESDAQKATRQIIVRYRITDLEHQLSQQQQTLDELDYQQDVAEYLKALKQLQSTRKQMEQLNEELRGSGSD